MQEGIPAEATASAGHARLDTFVASAGSRYAKERNFDLGPDSRGNVSGLSPYLRHRLLLEEHVLGAVLARHAAPAADSFVREVFWRIYLKGYLEQRPSIWHDYKQQVSRLIKRLGTDRSLCDRYETAVNGNTGIDCLDAWVAELVETGYLHNHARMWFASIWVYTLELPWQLGADFFYRHLLDGDPASNTLGWRWVCGLHTKGKTYAARVSNIRSYTNNRFNPQGLLATHAPPLADSRRHPLTRLPAARRDAPDGAYGLLLTEEDCHPESLPLRMPPAAIAVAVPSNPRSPFPVAADVAAFTSAAAEDAARRAEAAFGVSVQRLGAANLGAELLAWAAQQEIGTVATAYVPVGPAADRLAKAERDLETASVQLVRLRRDIDSWSWPHATKGYFRFKSQIPSILARLALPSVHMSPAHTAAGSPHARVARTPGSAKVGRVESHG